MIYLKRIIFRKWNTLFFALVFIMLFTALPYGFHQSWNANLNMMEAVENIERGSYDILIRPQMSSTDVEAILNTLEDSFALNIGEFSFSEDLWERVELDPIFDPYEEFQMDQIIIDDIGSPAPPRRGDGFTIEEWQRFVNDPRIELAAPIATIGFMDSIQQKLSIPAPMTNGNYRYRISFYTTDGPNEYLLDSHEHYFFNSDLILSNEGVIHSKVPFSSHLLVAVDPVLEQKMTGIDLSPLIETANSEDSSVKIIQRNELTTPVLARIEIEQLDIDLDLMDMNTEVMEKLQTVPIINENLIELDLTQSLKPFNGGEIKLQQDGSLLNIESNYQSYLPNNFLFLESVEYKVPNFGVVPSAGFVGNLSVSQIANEETPIFRRRNLMEYIGKPRDSFKITTVGIFNPNEYEPPTMTAAPLGMYLLPNVTKEDGGKVVPTALPGSFIAQTASGITTLEAAQQIKGDQFIDAIRIRVADIPVFDVEARQKINELATEFANEWLDVTIVAGSALSEQILEVEGIGEVTVPWILIGAVPGMARNFDVLTFTTITLFTVFMLIWLSSRLKAENSLLAEESEILAHIGWTEKQIRTHELKSQQIFLILLNVISMFLLFILDTPIVTYFISLGLLLSALAVPYLIHSKHKIRIWNKPFKAGQAVNFYWKYYMPIIILLWISFQVIAIITASQYRVLANFNATEIGQTLINPVNSLMIFLLILAYTMTVIAVFESISVILKERKDEFVLYQLIGWKPKTIYLYLVKESTQWLFHPLLSAGAVSIILSLLLSFIFGGTLVVLILGAIILLTFKILTEKKIIWNLTTWNWAGLGSILISSIILGSVYSPTLVIPTILINLFTLISISILILITIYISLKQFYKA